MGPEWQSRLIVGYVFSALLVFLIVTLRWFSSCDTANEIIIALVIGTVVGSLFYFVNNALFGQEAMNFLGLPYLVDKYKQGSPIYVCSANTEST
jgi:hypothetical protein